jgi:hypothetical protein
MSDVPRVDGQPITMEDLTLIGAALLNSIGTTALLGHKSPAGTLDYSTGGSMWHSQLVRDVIAWSSGHVNKAPGCRERLLHLMHDGGWLRRQMEATVAKVVDA